MASCITDAFRKCFRSHRVTEFEPHMMNTSEDDAIEISSSSGNQRYDVFPSFSGQDVRKTFLSHLLKEFSRRSINSFIDNGIVRSRLIAPELLSAIENSSISIVIFSKNYASSTWCLNELVKIHECYKKLDQMVIPVFYDVDPSDVRKQTGKFGKVFKVTCKNKTEDEKQRWVQALADVASIAGEDLRNGPDEAHVVEKIANDVSNKLILTLNSFADLVGIEAHLEAMKYLLCLDSEEARMVGIWGTSGIGKSTIGRALFSQLSGQFPLRIFITYKESTDHDGLDRKLSWERKFLSEILCQKDIKMEHSGVVKNRFKDKKVLIVLDNVDNIEFLETLVGKAEWFGPGSRIIVITQDRRLLKAHDIDLLYEVNFPSEDLALKMLCRYAFRENYPPDDFKELAVEVARRAANLPLGLSVLGSFLKGRDKIEWLDLLLELQDGLDGNIMKTLRVSYDRLAKKDQCLFHYIAWLFNGDSVKFINDFLGDVNVGLKTLADKSLIRITPDDIVEVHSLLEKLATEIDRAESNGNPGKRRFLKNSNEILDVFTDKTGTETVLGICLSLSQLESSCNFINANSLEGMLNLQVLKIHGHWKPMMYLHDGLDYLPRKLKWLEWNCCPLKCLPSDFKAEYLVELRMNNSKLEKLWEGTQLLGSLKTMIMRNSKCLKETPDLSKAKKLKRVDLYNCRGLVSFSAPLNSDSLEFLDLRECPRLKNFPEIIMRSSSHGTEIEVVDCLWNKNLPGFDYLDCFKRSYPSKFHPEHLVDLTVNGNMQNKLWEGVQSLGSLAKIDLSDCGNLETIPDLSKATNLEHLILSNCKSLVKFPYTIGNLQKLVRLEMKECTGLEVLPVDVNLLSLEFLDLRGCSNLRSFPQISKSINILHLDDTAIEEVPCCIEMLPKLTELSMNGCKMLKKLPQISSSIETLNLGETAIEKVPCFVENLSRLTKLSMHGCKELKNISPNIFRQIISMHVGFTDRKGVITTLSDATVVTTIKKRHKSDQTCGRVKLDSLYKRRYCNFQNCFKLDRDAREIILRSCFMWAMVLPGGEVPTYFTHRAYGYSLIVIVPHKSLYQGFLRFNVCVVIEPLTDSYACLDVHIDINGNRCTLRVVEGMRLMCKTDHLMLCSFKFRPTGLPPRLAFYNVELAFSCHKRIKECGIRLLNVSPYSDEIEYNQQPREKCHAVETESIKKPKWLTLQKTENCYNFSCGQIVADRGLTALNLELPLGKGKSSSISYYPCLEGEALGVGSIITKQQDAQIPIVAPTKPRSCMLVNSYK